jgi:outer membrane protein assembly factor BamB
MTRPSEFDRQGRANRRGRPRWTWLGGGLALLLLAVAARAQRPEDGRSGSPFHPDDSITAEALLRNAARQVAQSQWAEAIDLYERAVAQHGDALARVPRAEGGSTQATLYVNVRAFVQSTLSRLPAEGLAAYRRRADAPAADLLQRGLRGDLSALRRVVDEYFATASGDEALDLLGDAAFRDGRYRLALSYYRGIVPAADAAAEQAVYPDPDVDRGRVAAKILLCRAALGDIPTPEDLAAFRAAYPEARGRLAGREGLLADVVARAISEDGLTPGPASLAGWPTFAGAPTRDGVAPERIDVGSFQWRVSLAARRAEPDDRIGRGGVLRAGPVVESPEPSVHPIIVGGLVIVGGEDRVTAFRLNARSGEGDSEPSRREAVAWEQRLPGLGSASSRGLSTAGPGPQTLTASGDRVIARLGEGRSGGVLLAIRSNAEVEGKLLWKKSAGEVALPARRQRAGDRGVAAFEGTPVADESRVYVGLTDPGAETDLFVACIELESGQPAWVRYLGTANAEPERGRLAPGAAHRLLTLDGDRVYYQTNLGAVACLDAQTGAIRWLATYPTRDRQVSPELRRSPNPAVAHGGRVYVAPADAAEIFAFDASSGRPLWSTPPLARAQHLLGVAAGRLYATGDRVYSIDPATGRVLRAWPEYGGYEGHGRGLLAGDRIYWPTRTDILVVDQATGGDVHESIPLWQLFGHGGGNLAVGDGYLAVAQRDRLVVYGQGRRLIERRREEVVAAPDKASLRFALGRLEEAAGELEAAQASYAEARRRAQPGDVAEGRALGLAARAREHGVLMALGRDAVAAGEPAAAIARFEQAREIAESPRDRLAALLALAEAESAAGQPKRAVAVLQTIPVDPAARDQYVAVEEGRRVRADILAAERLRGLITQHGVEVYAEFESRADTAREAALRDADPRALLALAAAYPVAAAARRAVRESAELADRLDRPADAVAAYGRWLQFAADGAERARALVGLARAHAALGQDGPAREVAGRALDAYAELDLRGQGLEGDVATLLAPLTADDPGPIAAASIPLEPAWTRSLASGRRVGVLASGSEPGSGLVVPVVEGRALEVLDARDGRPLWARELSDEFSWVAQDADRLLVAGLRQVVALDLRSGEPLWAFDPARGELVDAPPDPFARPDPGGPAEVAEARPTGRLHGFRRLGPRLFFLRGDRELVALDTRVGRVAWSFRPPRPARGGAPIPGINPFWSVASDRVVVQYGPENTVAAFDPETGAVLERMDRGIAEPPWCADPVALDAGRVVLAIDPHTLALVDLAGRADVWSYHDDSPLPWSAAPRVLARDGVLLALLGGQELLRLDPADGRRLWRRALGLVDISDGAETVALDDVRVYIAQPGRVVAYRLTDGEPGWTRRLPDEGHGAAVRLVGPYLLAHSRPGPGSSGPLGSTAVLLCRRDDGSPSQSIPLRGPIRDLTVRASTDRLVVSTQSALEVWCRPRGAPESP